jgi:hypothetical protein
MPFTMSELQVDSPAMSSEAEWLEVSCSRVEVSRCALGCAAIFR